MVKSYKQDLGNGITADFSDLMKQFNLIFKDLVAAEKKIVKAAKPCRKRSMPCRCKRPGGHPGKHACGCGRRWR